MPLDSAQTLHVWQLRSLLVVQGVAAKEPLPQDWQPRHCVYADVWQGCSSKALLPQPEQLQQARADVWVSSVQVYWFDAAHCVRFLQWRSEVAVGACVS